MSSPHDPGNGPFGPISRRAAIGSTFLAGAAFLRPFDSGAEALAQGRTGAPKRYDMKKSINLWAFPYPQTMNLRQCLQLAKDAGFDGIELNYDLETTSRPSRAPTEFQEIRRMADRIGIAISGLCSFLFWPYPLTSNDEAKRGRGMELAGHDGAGRPRPGHAESARGVRVRSTSPGATIMNRSETMCAIAGRREAIGTLMKTPKR